LQELRWTPGDQRTMEREKPRARWDGHSGGSRDGDAPGEAVLKKTSMPGGSK
jgi:hypothetical protein